MFISIGFIASLLVCCTNARLAAEFIVGGVETKPHEIGYIVSIQLYGADVCGGGIISDQYIVTAAHCVIDGDKEFYTMLPLTVVAGINDVNDENHSDGVKIDIVKAYVLKMYSGQKAAHGDIAVLKLKDKLNLAPGSKLTKLNLPQATGKKLTSKNSFVGKKALIAGFGWDKVELTTVKDGNKTKHEEDGSSSGKLLKAKALVIENSECKKLYAKYNIDSTQICARIVQHPPNVHQGVCSGDSGSPLVYNNTVLGVVSFNYLGCNDNKRPGVYTRVSAYVDFIKNAEKDIVTDDMRVGDWPENDSESSDF